MNLNFLRVLMLALALIGVLGAAYAVYTYIEAQRAISEFETVANNLASMNLDQMPDEQRQAVLSSVPPAIVLDYQQATQDRNLSLVVGGVGLVLLGIGWLGYDWFSRRAARQTLA